MVKAIMHGCNGHMGQVITGLIKDDPEIEIVAGIDPVDCRDNGYPVFPNLEACTVDADVIIDFTSAKAADGLLKYCVEKKIPVVLCSTGLSEEQLTAVEEASKQVAVLKSANMSLGINMLMKILQDAAKILVPTGFDIEIVEKHHNRKLDAPSGTALALAESTSLECSAKGIDKGVGLKKLCEHLGLPLEQTIAVGDADNDTMALKTAGLSIAMGNATEPIKALADVIVADCDHNGCAEAIDKYLLAKNRPQKPV